MVKPAYKSVTYWLTIPVLIYYASGMLVYFITGFEKGIAPSDGWQELMIAGGIIFARKASTRNAKEIQKIKDGNCATE